MCASNVVADRAAVCVAAGWAISSISGFPNAFPTCAIRFRLYADSDEDGRDSNKQECTLDSENLIHVYCTELFGDPLQFPVSESDYWNDRRLFVANCSRGGSIPGGIPATINTISATECTCGGASGHIGDWPDCTCIAGQGVLANGTCGVCPSGQGVLADGTCGACTGGAEGIDGVCQCPAGYVDNTNPFSSTKCIPQMVQDRIDKCNAITDEHSSKVTEASVPGVFTCDILTRDVNFDSSTSTNNRAEASSCVINDLNRDDYPDIDYLLCSAAFGPDLAFPQKPTDGSDPRYVFNCDPDGDNGLIPATINTFGATECACPAGQILQNDVCAVCPAGHIPQDGACAVCPAGQIVLNNACAVCADGEIVYRGVCTDASVLELSGKALTLYNLLVARVTLGNVNIPAYLYSLEQFQQGILDRHNGVANYLGDLLQYETSGLYGYRPFLIDSQTAGFGNYSPNTPGEIDRILSQIPVHTSGSSSAPFGSQACQGAGWIFSADDGGSSCGVPLTLSGGAVFNRCHLSGSDSPQCSAVFGSTVNYFPSPTLSADGATLRFVYNCDLDGSKGLIPATINTIGATECACFITGAPAEDGGACACPPGEGVRSDTGICGVCPAGEQVIGGFCLPGVIMNQCVAAGWSFSADGGSCGVLLTLAGGAAADKCYLSGDDSPQCEAVFGSTVNYFPSPTLSADGTTLRFVYNCDPDDENGLIPATANTILATECGCFGDTAARGGGCVPLSGDFGSLSDEVLCGAFGGMKRPATGGEEVCSGMDANDTFCIMDSADAFPCRGLFKHLRSCNLTHNRKALNPFFCGENCGAQKAVGSKCN